MKAIVITVTQDDIDQGMKNDRRGFFSWQNPIVLAAKRRFDSVILSDRFIYLGNNGQFGPMYQATKNTKDRISDMYGDKIKPGRFRFNFHKANSIKGGA